MKIPSFQMFVLNEDLNHTLLNDIYSMATVPPDTEGYGDRLYKLTTEEILQRFQKEAWPEILDILSREFLHVMETDEFSFADSYKFKPESEMDAEDCQRLIEVLGLKDLKQLRSFGNGLQELLEYREEETPVGFEDIQKVFKSIGANFTLRVMIDSFERLSWQSEFGGKAWVDITKAALKIGESLNQKGFAVFYKAVDHFVDLAHNTNSVLDKFKGYDEGWLFYWVDLKRYSKSVYDLKPVSKGVQEYIKTARGNIHTSQRYQTDPKQNLYEVMLRGKQFLNELTARDHDFHIHQLKVSPMDEPDRNIEILKILKRNRISFGSLIQTMQQIVGNVETKKETLIEQQERNNYRRIKAFLRDIHGIFYAALHLKPGEQINVLRHLGINPTNNPGGVINYWLQQSHIQPLKYN